MKNYKQINFKKAAEKFLKSRTRKEQLKLLEKIYQLPDGTNIKKMEGYENRYRLWVGDVRVLYDMFIKHDDKIEILIVEMGNRGDIYK